MALTLKDTQKATGVIKFVDSKGADTDAASVVATSNNEGAATVSYDDPTNTLTVTAGLPGVAAIHIEAKDSAGNTLPVEDIAVEVTAGEAVGATIEFNPPTEQ